MTTHRIIIDEDFQDIVPGYLERRHAELDTIGERVNQEDFSYLKRLSHDWHGTGESYGIPFISEIGEKMNLAANAGDGKTVLALADRLRDYLEHLDIRYE